jgi:hypothetical protein
MRKGKPIPLEEIQEHYAAKGKKGTGKQALQPYADGLDEDGGETAEEEVPENDMEGIPEEAEGNDDEGGTDEPADGAPTLPMTSVAVVATGGSVIEDIGRVGAPSAGSSVPPSSSLPSSSSGMTSMSFSVTSSSAVSLPASSKPSA